jgi:hypothetical protein
MNPSPPDKYDKAVAFLTANPYQIHTAWSSPEKEPGGCLFNYVGHYGDAGFDGSRIGCLTQIRGGILSAPTEELTMDIRRDPRIPSIATDIKAEHLPVLAEWQRKIDTLGIR